MRKFFQLYSNRIDNLTISIFAISLIILSSFFKIQILEREIIKQKVINKGFKEITMHGDRGRILDSKNNQLSASINKYDFWINTNKPFDSDKII